MFCNTCGVLDEFCNCEIVPGKIDSTIRGKRIDNHFDPCRVCSDNEDCDSCDDPCERCPGEFCSNCNYENN